MPDPIDMTVNWVLDKWEELVEFVAPAFEWLIQPTANADAPPESKPKKPDEAPTIPVAPDDKVPKKPNPTPVAPPLPKNPFTKPLPSPEGKPIPEPPERELPKDVDLKQKEHKITSYVVESLAYRKYGCLLYTPVVTTPLKIYGCDFTTIEEDIDTDQPEALKRWIAWLISKGNRTLEELRENPAMDAWLNSIGIGETIEDLLIDKACDLALVGINFFTKGAGTSIIGKSAILYGCKAILQLSMMYAERNYKTIGKLHTITDAYLNIEVIDCPETPSPEYPNTIPEALLPGDVQCWEPDTVLLPDSAAFMNSGKYAILFWVLADDPNYRTYYTTWQIPDPIPALYDFIAEDGTIPPGGGSTNWDTYFKDVNRTQGHQFSRLYSEERKHPVAAGHFLDKDDAIQCFDKIIAMTSLTKRSKAPYVHSSAVADEYLKELSHVGKKMVLRKVNIIDKKAFNDSGVKLITYKAPPP